MNSTAALITLADNVFRTVLVEDGEGIFSPRTGKIATRKTGYVVGLEKPHTIEADVPKAIAFTSVVQHIASNPGATAWATEEPLYFTGSTQPDGTHMFNWVIVVNDLQEAVRRTLAQGDRFFIDLAANSLIEIEVPSAAAQQFLKEVMELEIAYGATPSGPPLNETPGLEKNPWDTPYNRTHL